jgi:uncharacterized membrane protein required for colicin V production
VDIILVGFIAGFIFGGWRSGFLKRLVGIAFVAISFLAAVFLRYPVGAIASTFFKDIPADYAQLVGATIVFPVVLAALHLASRAVFGRIQVHGIVAEGTDKILGAILGGIEAVLILSVGIVILDAYYGTASSLGTSFHSTILKDFTEQVNSSETVKLLRDTTVPIVLAIVGPILPKDLHTLLPGGLPDRLPFPSSIP